MLFEGKGAQGLFMGPFGPIDEFMNFWFELISKFWAIICCCCGDDQLGLALGLEHIPALFGQLLWAPPPPGPGPEGSPEELCILHALTQEPGIWPLGCPNEFLRAEGCIGLIPLAPCLWAKLLSQTAEELVRLSCGFRGYFSKSLLVSGLEQWYPIIVSKAWLSTASAAWLASLVVKTNIWLCCCIYCESIVAEDFCVPKCGELLCGWAPSIWLDTCAPCADGPLMRNILIDCGIIGSGGTSPEHKQIN